ncbi:MAG TPA: hypothetical protein VFS16_11720 [Acidimicrobiia bacterium]|nr:hypothetical protein [Acidimicrobiia bacterium]
MTNSGRDSTEATSMTCPRCGAEVEEVFYGPCGACRAQLRATFGGGGRDVAVEAAERVHRTPNFVATKD